MLWCISVSLNQSHSIKFKYFLRPSEGLIFLNFLGRLYTVVRESKVGNHFNDHFGSQFLYSTSLLVDFFVDLQTTNQVQLLLGL